MEPRPTMLDDGDHGDGDQFHLTEDGGEKAATPPGDGLDDGLDGSNPDGPMPDAIRLASEAVAICGDDAALADLVERFWRYAPDEELVGLTPVAMVDAAAGQRALAERRLPGELKLDIAEAPDGDASIVRIVTDDMPFLVDTVNAVLASLSVDVHLLVHPLMVVARAPLGALIEVRTDVDAVDVVPERGSGELIESWMYLEVDHIRDKVRIDQLRRALVSALTDVREAVEDWDKMRTKALEIADRLEGADLPVPERDIADGMELLRWLATDQFTFLGYREYALVTRPNGEAELIAKLGTGLGILRDDRQAPRRLAAMSEEARAAMMDRRLLVITKSSSRSTVHRNAYLDYIAVKTFDADGNVSGEKRFLGLFTASAYLHSVSELPVVRRKVAAVIERSGLSARSHSGRDLITILEDYPRDDLFQIRTDELFAIVMSVLRMAGRRQLRLFVRRETYGRFVSCLVYLPRNRFTTPNRLAIQAILMRELRGIGVDFTTRLGESLLARLQFIVRTDPVTADEPIDVEAIQAMLVEATRNWDDDFRAVLEQKVGDEQAKALYQRYAGGLPDIYKDAHLPAETVKDLAKFELLEEPSQLEMHIYRRRSDPGDLRFKVYRFGAPMMLSTVLPVLHSLGVRVSDERPYEITRSDGTIYVYDFGLVLPDGARDITDTRAHLQNAFAATWRGEAETDGFNELVLRAGLTWQQVMILRAYAKYLRQTGTVFTQESIEAAFIAYPPMAALLVAFFETRFAPSTRLGDEDRALQAKELAIALGRHLDDVASLDQDRILRAYLALVQATLRTSFFQRSADGRTKPYMALKIDPQGVPDLPAPRPRYEIFVYSPRFEGVHLRFGPVARGGIRWSDRRDDFRTEILGLVKAQMVKNSVIVPVGAKGGFVLKQAPSPADRDAYQAEGVACYRLFISGLLDITDNLVGGAVVPPKDVVRADSDDPYLVVAADKGTATFSDLANEISDAYGFWLGDAFASGGSAGYDHKAMGITARGAWESVKRHFRDMDVDIQSKDFTVVGIGDMSGDVFGNGMLLSEHIKLIAAFDHRHVFLDPDPDPARSFAERRRLFDLPRSSWADYDPSVISAGGGVYPRTAKSIPISPEVATVLRIGAGITRLTPPELMKAILLAPVDLLWNGGIGTYVKSSAESHAEVGDKANDAIRVSGAQLRAKVAGEGGNLGFTQRGRIEYALRMLGGSAEQTPGRISTDFIDNSAGVDTSDHEVNIKILLGAAVHSGDLDRPARDALLAAMTGEVGALVLRDNYEQARALGTAMAQVHSMLPVHRRLITDLERRGRLDRALEFLPSDEELAARGEVGRGLTQPELAVLLAYVKIDLEAELIGSTLPDDPWTVQVLQGYFPAPLRDKYADRMSNHRLHREIITTGLVNDVVNHGGITFLFRAMEESGASAADVIRAYVIICEVFGLPALIADVERLDTDPEVPTASQTAVYLDIRRLLDRGVRWLLSSRRPPLDVPAEVERLSSVSALLPQVVSLVRGEEASAMRERASEIEHLHIPSEVADRCSQLLHGFGLLDVVTIAAATSSPAADVAAVYYAVAEQFRVDALLTRISALPRHDRWETLARTALRYDLYGALAALTTDVLATTEPGRPEDRIAAWVAANRAAVERTRNAMGDLDELRAELAPLSVALRQIRTLILTTTA